LGQKQNGGTYISTKRRVRITLKTQNRTIPMSEMIKTSNLMQDKTFKVGKSER
jgi:hypothetical protein